MDDRLMRTSDHEIAYFARRANRLRAEAMALAFAAVAGGLKSLWSGIGRWRRAEVQARKSIAELRSLSDRILKDVGLRRDQIDCFGKRVPC